MMRFTPEGEVVAKANESPFGLGGYLHTADSAASSASVKSGREW
jgi:acyl-CoA reductase-like NAD-dependent aldehyde dehydrogenase